MSLTDDADLAVRARTDEDAFSQLYKKYLPLIYGYVTRRIADRDEAEDIVSHIFLKVVENIGSYKPKKSSFKTWIYTIATHTMIDYFRRHKKAVALEDAGHIASDSKSPQEKAEERHESEKVHRAIGALNESHQKILMLKFFSDLSVPELAEALAVSTNNVSVMTHRALQAFHSNYQKYV